MSDTLEVNFDGLVGPTHNYAGLSPGNLASQRNQRALAHPRAAALQGLRKMKFLADLGIKQAVLPPQPRPQVDLLRRAGFSGSDADVLFKAHRDAPRLLAACYSASSMWAANAATVSPSADCADGRVHFTTANLVSNLHRSIEPEFTARVLRAIFPDEKLFAHHPPLPAADALADEGAANHTRLCADFGSPGIELFTYGFDPFNHATDFPGRFSPRQSSAASMSIARLHQLDPANTFFLRQHPQAIDAGVFHNDVIAVGHRNVLLYHAAAFADAETVLPQIARRFEQLYGQPLVLIQAHNEQVTLADAVNTYFFNSQIVTLPDGSMTLLAPEECRHHTGVQRLIERILELSCPIRSVHYLDVHQSMQNGGGPACLRLRVVLTAQQIQQVHPGVWLTPDLYARLTDCVTRHYRESLSPDDLADPSLAQESLDATEKVWRVLGIAP